MCTQDVAETARTIGTTEQKLQNFVAKKKSKIISLQRAISKSQNRESLAATWILQEVEKTIWRVVDFS